MGYKPGDSWVGEFTTCNPTTGAAVNADVLPTATMAHNGVDDGTVTVTVTNITTGRYKATATIPVGYASGDTVHVAVNATVSATAGTAIIDSFVLDSKRLSDLVTGNLVNVTLDNVTVESGLNARQALSIIASAISGVLAGAGTTTITIAAANNNATNRVTATVDASGNRSAVTLNIPA